MKKHHHTSRSGIIPSSKQVFSFYECQIDELCGDIKHGTTICMKVFMFVNICVYHVYFYHVYIV